MPKNEADIALTQEEHRLHAQLVHACAHRWEPAAPDVLAAHPGARRIVFERDYALHDIFQSMMQGGNEPLYALGAKMFVRIAGKELADRQARSHVLTRLARAQYDGAGGVRFSDIREAQVSAFGRFLRPIIEEHPAMVVEWAEDAGADDPASDFRPEPTAVLRGALFAPAIDHARCLPFWRCALDSSRFPHRVFTDPCPSAEGRMLSSYHVRTVVTLLSLLDDARAARLAGILRDGLTKKKVSDVVDGRLVDVVTAATDDDRQAVLSSIAESVGSPERRRTVSEAFGLR